MKRKHYRFDDKMDELIKAAMKAKGRTNESDYVRQAIVTQAAEDLGIKEAKRILA